MNITEEKKREYVQRILKSRMRLIISNPFFGVLLMHMHFALDETCTTAKTDGSCIAFGPEFMDELDDEELDFIMMHEIMHVVLKHVLRQGDRDDEDFNIACDIVVNSNIMLENGGNPGAITLRRYGESMHRLPDGTEGYKTTAEEAYEEIRKYRKSAKGCKGKKGSLGKARGRSAGQHSDQSNGSPDKGLRDDHSDWGKHADDPAFRDEIKKLLKDAYELMKVRDPGNQRGTIPAFAERVYKEMMTPVLDWRTVLTNFIQENIKDYSLCPPDRRYMDSPFFLPDFNDAGTVDSLHKVLFMIDTSGSISDDMMTRAYSEIKGAIDQFDGNISGWLGFFDAAVYEPMPFCDEQELSSIRPRGGGGTRFDVIFKYVREHMQDDMPGNIVILTDGYAPFPEEKAAMGIPVLWVINNEKTDPGWGKVARIL